MNWFECHAELQVSLFNVQEVTDAKLSDPDGYVVGSTAVCVTIQMLFASDSIRAHILTVTQRRVGTAVD